MPTEQTSIYQKEQESFVVAEADAGGQPRAMMIHLEHTFPARAAMMCPVRFLRLTFLAIAYLAGRLDSEGVEAAWFGSG
jgi:hypothetical protein